MASRKQIDKPGAQGAQPSPAWADGLKQLYDDVVEEPLPDAFKDLLEQLDAADEIAPDAADKHEKKGGS